MINEDIVPFSEYCKIFNLKDGSRIDEDRYKQIKNIYDITEFFSGDKMRFDSRTGKRIIDRELGFYNGDEPIIYLY